MKNILVIGATSAIASACARLWAGPETRFFLVGRSRDKLEQVAADLAARQAEVHRYLLDVTVLEGHAAMWEAAFGALGQVDLALIAHGSLPDQKACEQDGELAVREFAVNGLSVIALLTELARRMEGHGAGCIAVISSVAGDRGRPSNYLYGSAKSAVTAFCEGLRGRLHQTGPHVLTIKPGFVDTPMTQGLPLPALLLASPERVAQDIDRAVAKRRDTLYTPWFWRFIMLVVKHVPGPIFKKMRM